VKPRYYWRKLTLFTLTVVLLIAMVGVLYLSYTASNLLLHPARNQPTRTPADLGWDGWEEVRFSTSDGLELGGWFIPPDARGDGAILIFVHGHSANREEFLDEALMLTRYGYGSLLIDLRNHGQSEGFITTLGYAEVEDVRAAVDYVLTRPEANPERIGLVGHSMGGATVIQAAARMPQVRAVISHSAYASLTDVVKRGTQVYGLPSFPFASLIVWFGELQSGIKANEVRPIDEVVRIAPRAVLFIHGEQDTSIHVINSLNLYQAAEEPKALYLIPNAGHTGLFEANPSEYESQVVDFLDTYLGESEE
jgi:fermentation-respiration switch protein FrsA (DUF1100 family)